MNKGDWRPCAAMVFLFAAASVYAEPITTGSLIAEMVDLRRLADFPDPFYKTVQFSSYDRQSALPGGPYWFANSDGFGKERTPNFECVLREPAEKGGPGEYLVCDVEGPGAIVRQWTARIAGDIRLYLDDVATPVFEGPAEEFFLRPYDRYFAEAGLDTAILEDTFYQRNAAYCPVPFRHRCRVVWSGRLQATHFYQLEVRRYAAGTEVATFAPGDVKRYEPEIQHASAIMRRPDEAWEYASTESPVPFDLTVPPGEQRRTLDLEGPKAIEKLSLSVEAADRDLALRQTILHVVCDRYPWAQVQAPVGDFFGAAPGVNPYTSVPFTVGADGAMTSRFFMPCGERLRIEFENLGEQPVQIRGEALPTEYAWNAETSMHFRARWRIDHGLVGAGAPPQDMPYLLANGRGVYVGSVVYVLNPNEIPTAGGNWWGEGDEKVFTDDDVRPSLFGTGSEDYYNYAWSKNDIFFFPYCGQPVNSGPANRGFVANYRWHILDPLPFKYRLSFYMELFPHERTHGMAYGRIGYHYARPGLMDDHIAITAEDVRRQELPANWQPASRGQARNSLFYQAEDLEPSAADASIEQGRLWAGGALYRWQPKAVGEELALHLRVDAPDHYRLRIAFALDKNSGKVSAQLQGKVLALGEDGPTVDLHRPYRTMLRCFGGDIVHLEKGVHALTLRYEGGSGPDGAGTVGIDFIWLQGR